jgi:hypothetical protein
MSVVDKKKRPTTPAPWQDVTLAHLPLIATGLISIFVFARLFVIAHGNVQTARAMLSAAGTVEVALGTLLTALPVAGLALLMGGALYARSSEVGIQMFLAIGALLLGVLLAALTIPSLAVISFIVGAAVVVVGRPTASAVGRVRPPSHFLILAYMALVGLYLLASDEPWLPAEKIAVDGRPAFVGYVLATENDSVVVLTREGRLVERFGVEDVASRHICRPPGWPEPSIHLWRSDDRYPKC